MPAVGAQRRIRPAPDTLGAVRGDADPHRRAGREVADEDVALAIRVTGDEIARIRDVRDVTAVRPGPCAFRSRGVRAIPVRTKVDSD